MKKILSILAISAVLGLLPGCNKWLEATSSSQISADQLFSSRSGFHEALSGVYLSMGDFNAYGGYYTWFVNELTGSPLMVQNSKIFDSFQRFQYTNATSYPVINAMWQSGYNVIANINKILLELDRRRDVVKDEREYALIRGELLALRAYVHFDMMRMWGVADWRGDNAAKLTIPYVTEYKKEPTNQRSYAETAALLSADLDEAIQLLEADPIRGTDDESFQQAINPDGYWDHRNFHLNWYAARALKARVLLWKREYAQAAALAQEIMDEVLDKGIASWTNPVEQLNKDSNDDRDWTFSSEHLFTLEVTALYDSVNPYYFKTGTYDSCICLTEEVVRELYQSPVYYTYATPEPDPAALVPEFTMVGDIRGPAMMLKYAANKYQIFKFYGSSSSFYRNRIPMIRLSELYMMCAEAAEQQNNNQALYQILNTLHGHRGVDDLIPTDSAKPIVINDNLYLIWAEMVREFIGEGQLFYFVKRRGGEILAGNSSEMIPGFRARNLTYPYPTEEISYGHIQEL